MNLKQNKTIAALLILMAIPIIFSFQNCSKTQFSMAEDMIIAHDSNGLPAVPVAESQPTVPPEIEPTQESPPIVVADQPLPETEPQPDVEVPSPEVETPEVETPEVETGNSQGGRFVFHAVISGYQIVNGVSYNLSPNLAGTLPCGMPATEYVQSCNIAVPAVCSASLKNYIKTKYAKPSNGEVTAVVDCKVVQIIGR